MKLLGKILAVVALLGAGLGVAQSQINVGGFLTALTTFFATGNGATSSASPAVRSGRVVNLTDDFGAVADTIITQMNVTTTTGGSATTVDFAKTGSFATPSFTAANVGNLISIAGAGAAGGTLITVISAVNSTSQIVVANGASTALTGSAQYVSYGTDNTSKIQAAINSAQTFGLPLRITAQGPGCFGYSSALAISNNLEIVGDSLKDNWGSLGINIPLGTPALLGSVLCPTSNGYDAIDVTGSSLQVDVQNLGILFQTPLVNTGDGFNYIPSGINQGLTGTHWSNVSVYGNDGNHYAYNLQNPIYGQWNYVHGFGGGILKINGNAPSGDYGNMTFVELYGQTIVGGSANSVNLTANRTSSLNLLHFVRPQMIVDSVAGVSPVTNPPTISQQIWYEDTNVTAVSMKCADMETNISSPVTFGSAGVQNIVDYECLATDAGQINVPAWGTNGIMSQPNTRTFNDTTSSGTGANTFLFAFPGTHVSANSVVNFPVLATMSIAPPIQSTNVSYSRLAALYATGEIYTTGDLSSAGGAFISGTTSLSGGNSTINKSSNFTTEIGDGTTTQPVNIGGASNAVKVGSNIQVTGSSPANTGTCSINTQLGGPMAGSFKANGACAAGTVIFTFTAAPNGWSCDAHDLTTTADAINETAYTTTSVTFTATMAASDLAVFKCIGF